MCITASRHRHDSELGRRGGVLVQRARTEEEAYLWILGAAVQALIARAPLISLLVRLRCWALEASRVARLPSRRRAQITAKKGSVACHLGRKELRVRAPPQRGGHRLQLLILLRTPCPLGFKRRSTLHRARRRARIARIAAIVVGSPPPTRLPPALAPRPRRRHCAAAKQQQRSSSVRQSKTWQCVAVESEEGRACANCAQR